MLNASSSRTQQQWGALLDAFGPDGGLPGCPVHQSLLSQEQLHDRVQIAAWAIA